MPDMTQQKGTRAVNRSLFLLSGSVAIAIGFVASIYGSGWSESAFELFAGIELMETIGNYAPYFSFVPFFPVFLIMCGAFLIVKSRE